LTKKTARIEPPEPVFTLFDSSRKDLPEVVFVNEALLSFEHLEIFPWHLSVEIDYTEFAEKGMPAPEEGELLNRICDQIEPAVLDTRTNLDAVNALFLARSTWDGIRELAFQIHDPDVTHQSLQKLLKSREWERYWQYEMRHDPTWQEAAYFFKLFSLADGDNS
jgi:hypothetical protein